MSCWVDVVVSYSSNKAQDDGDITLLECVARILLALNAQFRKVVNLERFVSLSRSISTAAQEALAMWLLLIPAQALGLLCKDRAVLRQAILHSMPLQTQSSSPIKL